MDLHGVSVVQASLDLKEYIRLYPDNLIYDRTAKTYIKAPTYLRKTD